MKETYIQKGADSKRTFSSFNLLVKSVSLPTYPELKEVVTSSYPDTTGDTENIPSTPYFKAYTFSVKLAYEGAEGTFLGKLNTFLAYIGNSEFSFFDVYQNRGVRCRYEDYDEDVKYRRREGRELYEFTLNFKVNKPTTYGLAMPLGTISETAPCKTMAYWSNGTSETFLASASVVKNLGVLDSFAIFEPLDENYLRIK